MKLVIAEKPMLARDIARAVCGKEVSETARLPISGNGYTVCTCAGHLLKLKEPDDIDPKWKWDKHFDVKELPIYIDNWPKEPIPGKEGLVESIKNLLDECASVVHAGDPDDEGQLIVDEVLDYCGYRGKVERVLVNDNIEKNIRKAFEKKEDNSLYRGMGNAAYARSMADFSFGASESRLAAMRLRQRVSVGRVQTPTLGLVVRRDEEIENHAVRKFYELFALTDVSGLSGVPFKFEAPESLLAGEKKIFDVRVLEPVQKAVDGMTNAVTTKVTEKRSFAPLPYNLTLLQSEMNKQCGYTAEKTLEYTQSLRDKHKAISYNRSDCQYLPEEHHAQAEEVLACAMYNIGEDWPLDYTIKSKAFNDANISAHHGIIPQQSKFSFASLTEGEKNVYTAIVVRYAMQFLSPVVSEVSESRFDTAHGAFVYNAERVRDAGYEKVFPSGEKSEAKPWIDAGDHKGVVGGTKIAEKETTPPKPYTEGTLITDMASIAKYVKDEGIKEILKRKDDGKKGEHGGIGTTATRSDIIEKLKDKGFIEVKGKTLRSTLKGREFYHLLPDEIRQADTTAKWWLIQEAIATGEADVNAIQKSVCEVFNAHKDTAYIGKSLGGDRKIIGKCPKCGEDIVENKNVWTCSSNKMKKNEDNNWEQLEGCGFRVFKTAFGKKLSEAAVKQLLNKGTTTKKVKGLKSKKTGKTFEAYLDLDKETGNLKPRF